MSQERLNYDILWSVSKISSRLFTSFRISLINLHQEFEDLYFHYFEASAAVGSSKDYFVLNFG